MPVLKRTCNGSERAVISSSTTFKESEVTVSTVGIDLGKLNGLQWLNPEGPANVGSWTCLGSPWPGEVVELVSTHENCGKGFSCSKIRVSLDALVRWSFPYFPAERIADSTKDIGPKSEVYVGSIYLCDIPDNK
jgi:hypothetical protein